MCSWLRQVTKGSAKLGETDLLEMEPHAGSTAAQCQSIERLCEAHDMLRALEERALEGLFLAFQSPPAVGGERSSDLL